MKSHESTVIASHHHLLNAISTLLQATPAADVPKVNDHSGNQRREMSVSNVSANTNESHNMMQSRQLFYYNLGPDEKDPTKCKIQVKSSPFKSENKNSLSCH